MICGLLILMQKRKWTQDPLSNKKNGLHSLAFMVGQLMESGRLAPTVKILMPLIDQKTEIPSWLSMILEK